MLSTEPLTVLRNEYMDGWVGWWMRGVVETVTGFIFLGSKITADGDSSHEIKRHFLLGRRAMTNLVVVIYLLSCV